MKKKIFALILSVALLASCTSFAGPRSDSGVKTRLAEKEYIILGDVLFEGTHCNLFGLFDWGGATYYDLLQRAREEYNADEVINISLDIKTSAFLGIYVSRKYIMRGVVIKYQ